MTYASDLRQQGQHIAPRRCREKHPGEYHVCEEKLGHSGEHIATRPPWTVMSPNHELKWSTPVSTVSTS